MTANDILKSKSASFYVASLLDATSQIKFPTVGKRRDRILSRLEEMNESTSDTLEAFLTKPRPMVFTPKGLTDIELYMLRQRHLCALDILSRLADSEPSSGWLTFGSGELDEEDAFLYQGLWNEFGQYWLSSLAWRIARGLEA